LNWYIAMADDLDPLSRSIPATAGRAGGVYAVFLRDAVAMGHWGRSVTHEGNWCSVKSDGVRVQP
jgi:hypothetical protein